MSVRSLMLALGVLSVGPIGAMAADMPLKAPPVPVVVPYSWTGCYIGVNAGGAWGRMREDWDPNPAGFPTSGPSLIANGSGSYDGDGWVGGGQIGCNWQTQSIVWGVEGDIDYSGLTGSRDVAVPAAGAVAAYSIHEDFRSRWLATVRGRVGWAIDRVLLYVTGGLAVSDIRTTDTAVFPASATFNSVTATTTRAGWTVGGGIEWAFLPHWSIKAEYLYVDLGSFSTTSANSNPGAFPLSTIVHNHNLTENIARLGLNFKF